MSGIYKLVALVLCMSFLLSGCSLWMDGQYSSVTPNLSQGEQQTDDVALVNSYQQICDVLAEMVEDGVMDKIVYATGLTDTQIKYYMSMAINYIMQTNPIGAYAVKNISYEIGTNMGKQAIALNVSYNHNRSEILRIKQAKDMNDVQVLMRVALENCSSGLVVFVKEYQSRDLVQYVEDFMNNYPQTCMEMPQVSVSLYPELGKERMIEVSFTYQNSRESLKSMQELVGDIFQSAHLYVYPGAQSGEKYSQLYSFLMERYEYTIETSITPAYSLLRHGVGDSKAFAVVYAAICRQAGLNCQVVSGTKAGEAWHWNVLEDEGTFYHLDLLECNAAGSFFLKTEEEMEGYVWDFSEFEEPQE